MRSLLATVVLSLIAATAAADPLFDAVAKGDRVAVERVLAAGAEVDSRARDQATALMNAALGDQPAIAELLIDKGANVMARNSGGFTPLHAAAYSGSASVAKLLLDHGAVLDDADNKAGVTPMMVAGEKDHAALVEFLISRGADIGHPEIHGYMPITRALWKGNDDVVRLYKRHGASCQQPDAANDTEENYQRCLSIHD